MVSARQSWRGGRKVIHGKVGLGMRERHSARRSSIGPGIRVGLF